MEVSIKLVRISFGIATGFWSTFVLGGGGVMWQYLPSDMVPFILGVIMYRATVGGLSGRLGDMVMR